MPSTLAPIVRCVARPILLQHSPGMHLGVASAPAPACARLSCCPFSFVACCPCSLLRQAVPFLAPARQELIREFYANLTSSDLTEVPVRGIKVPISSNAINEFFELPDFENVEYSSLMSNVEPENLQEILEELTVLGSKWTMSNLMPSLHGTTISLEQMVLLYSILTGKTIDVGKIILREIRICATKCSGPAYFPFTITILCLNAEILTNVKKTGYSQGTITYRDLY
ncbi:hypothetical protein PVK06_047262 [Gossypium arboreum]|uniref:Putative plant transposon protein domain-containing protein n=1 Tax=Gossypium arboreum TaxID=29729 RepID=A0ABR0MCT4_GOSAR|nr:hypothetical protein PVK06_047262 [Gossypium arboreum]